MPSNNVESSAGNVNTFTGIRQIMRGLIRAAMVLMFIFFVASEGQAQAYVFERLWPQLPQPWYFNHPAGIATDKQGNIYVSDAAFNCIRVFDRNGMLLKKWGTYGSGDGQFNYPSALGVDSSGNIFVADPGNSRIQVFNSAGTFLRKWGSSGSGDGQFNGPSGIGADSSGSIFVLDRFNARIQVFNSSGTFLRKWGSLGSGEGQFAENPRGIAVDSSGNVLVVDARIQVFNSSGTFLRKWGSSGSGDGQFNHASGLAVDASGNVYVTDTNNHRIQVFNSNGTFLRKWGSQGFGDQQLQFPEGVAVDASDNLFVTDSGNSRIQVFSSDGTFLVKWGSSGSGDGRLSGPNGIAVDIAGNVFVLDFGNSRIQAYNSEGTFLRKWGSSGINEGEFSDPQGIAVDASGNVYVADTSNHRIQAFDSKGAFLRKWGSRGSGDGQLQFPKGVAVDASRNIYVVDSGNHQIQVFSSDGTFLRKWGSFGYGVGQFFDANSIAVDTSGNVYVAEFQYQIVSRIQVFDSSGTFLRAWTAVGSDFVSVAADSPGNMFVVKKTQSTIQVVNSSGIEINKWGLLGGGEGQFFSPEGIAVDTSGNVFVADTGNNRIQKFAKVGGAPGAATLVSPSGSISTATPPYTWNALPTATWYYLWVEDASAVPRIQKWYTSAQAGCASGTGTCSITPTTALALGDHQWWIQTWNDGGFGPWSDGMKFTVMASGVPGKATLISPSGNINTTTPVYTWNAVPSVTWYQLWVNDSATSPKIKAWYTAAQAGCAAGTGTCSVTPATALASGSGQWWIQTWNDSGDGPWSDPLQFTVVTGGAPGKAVLVSPTGTITTTTPTYIWNAVSTATWYYLWVNDNTGAPRVQVWYKAAEAGCASGSGLCSVTPGIGLTLGAGQWWIQTWNEAGYGPWSDAMSFTVMGASIIF